MNEFSRGIPLRAAIVSGDTNNIRRDISGGATGATPINIDEVCQLALRYAPLTASNFSLANRNWNPILR